MSFARQHILHHVFISYKKDVILIYNDQSTRIKHVIPITANQTLNLHIHMEDYWSMLMSLAHTAGINKMVDQLI